MKALVYTGPQMLDYRDEPEPEPVRSEVLVKIDTVGICGSDMHAYLGHDERRPAPLILGHEAAGMVVSGKESGRRVTINPLVTCGKCPACRSGRNNLCAEREIISMPPRQGAFAQYVSMPPENLVTVPEDFPIEKASLAEPLACGWHAVRLGLKASALDAEHAKCVVIGGGAIGLASALALLASGAKNVSISEVNSLRHKTLEQAGPFAVYDPRKGGPVSSGEADIVIDAVGFSATRSDACRLVKPGGVIVHIGLGEAEGGVDTRRITLQEISFIGTYTYSSEDFRETANAMFDGRLGSLDWFEVRALAEGAEAFSNIRDGKVSVPKTVFKPNQ